MIEENKYLRVIIDNIARVAKIIDRIFKYLVKVTNIKYKNIIVK